MNYTHPSILREGDKVALISPAGPVPEPSVVDQCREELEKLGFTVWTGPSAGKFMDYHAGTDAERTKDLMDALTDPDIKAVFCTRGGYGSGRLLPGLDYRTIAANPRMFAGFSDLTAVHAALMKKAGIATLHSPTIASALVYESQRIEGPSRGIFLQHLTSAEPIGSIREKMQWNDPWTIRGGKAAGKIFGGNLAVFSALVGTPYIPEPEGMILFLEDVGEEPYRLDRCFTQLEQSGYLSRVEGIILGQFTDAEPSNPKREKIDVVLPRILGHLPVPILGNFPAGHVPVHASLPFGCRVEMDADSGDVILVEAFGGE